MFLLSAKDLSKQYGSQLVVSLSELSVYRGDKIGVVGANGAGKSTLLGLLAGTITPDRGEIQRRGTIKFLQQFSPVDPKLSGGENQKREILALKHTRDLVVFADEPTANLDIQGREWLEKELNALETLLLISHDRQLLDHLCTRIWEIEEGTLTQYTGNYAAYLEEKEMERQRASQQVAAYQKKKRQLEQAVATKERRIQRMHQSAKRNNKNNNSEARLWKGALSEHYKQVEQEKSALKERVDRLERPEQQKEASPMRLDFSLTNPPQNKRVIVGEQVSFSYGETQIFQNFDFVLHREERLAICGDNGAGKTTLLQLIHQGYPGITVVPKGKIGFLTQDFAQLDLSSSILDNVLATNVQSKEQVFGVLAALLFTGSQLEKQAGVLSGGERIRLSLAKLVLSDRNLLLLDEPTNFLDIQSLIALENTLIAYPGSMILVSHDRGFVDRVATRKIWIHKEDLGNTVPQKAVVKVDRLVLELERSRLVEQLGAATGAEKKQLEAAYGEVLVQLKQNF